MRYAIVSDIHANWQAWTAVMADIHENKADTIVCLGDIVGYGPRPEEVLASIRQSTNHVVLGNHDAAACGLLDASMFNDHAREVVHWTSHQMTADSLDYLKQIPLTLQTEDILFVHAEVAEPGCFNYIETEEQALHHLMHTEAKVVFVGHTHKPLAYSYDGDSIKQLPDRDFHLAPGHRYLINGGSVGEPRSKNDIRARYAIYDSSSRAVYFRKVMFDVEAYRADLHEVGLSIQPYFLSIIDHEASQGRNIFDEMDMSMMAVPDKPVETITEGTLFTPSPNLSLPPETTAPALNTVTSSNHTKPVFRMDTAPAEVSPAPQAKAKNPKLALIFALVIILAGLCLGIWILFSNSF